MPISADILLDASAAVALISPDHEAHVRVLSELRGRRLGLAGHAAFEFLSVTTRMPPPRRLDLATASRVLATNFPATVHLSPKQQQELLTRLPHLGVSGGAIYDALVGEVARVHDRPLASCDARALGTYATVGCAARMLS